jgi:NAD(P)-dependent dehydrogenase (short-subunit alcohol dehydrogenase family)
MKAEALFDLSGHVVAVTGAASGLGLAMSEVVAMNGAHVIMADIDRNALDAAAEGLRAAGCKVETMLSDVARRATLQPHSTKSLSVTGGSIASLPMPASPAAPVSATPKGGSKQPRWNCGRIAFASI